VCVSAAYRYVCMAAVMGRGWVRRSGKREYAQVVPCPSVRRSVTRRRGELGAEIAHDGRESAFTRKPCVALMLLESLGLPTPYRGLHATTMGLSAPAGRAMRTARYVSRSVRRGDTFSYQLCPQGFSIGQVAASLPHICNHRVCGSDTQICIFELNTLDT